MRGLGVVAIGGLAVLTLTGCSVNTQTVLRPPENGEQRLTVGTVQPEIHGTSSVSQRTLTVIVKFDADKRVRDYAYHASRF